MEYLNKMQEERRSKYSFSQRAGFQVYPFSEAARKYQADMACVPKDAEIQDFSTVTSFTFDDVLRAKGSARRRGGLIYVQRDLGA